MTTYLVSLRKDCPVLSAGHRVAYDGDHCAQLHGPPYRAAARLGGALDTDGRVVTGVSVPLKRLLRTTYDWLAHRMLLPRTSRLTRVEADEAATMRYPHTTDVFPCAEVVVLPIMHTTAALRAWWIADQVAAAIAAPGQYASAWVAIAIAESFGQSAICYRAMGGT